MFTPLALLSVAVGGALGSVARYAVTVLTARALGAGFPWGTLTVNVVGSLLMGVLAVLLLERAKSPWAVFALTGVLGGFTTFSAFSLDALRFYERGDVDTALLYVGLSLVLSVVAVVAGVVIGRAL
jgi:CrcB protein